MTINKHKLPNATRLAPFISGGSALYFLNKVAFSDLPTTKYIVSLVVLTIVFIMSAFLYGYLTKLEKQKDTQFIDSTAQIVKHVFADYGVRVAAGPYPVNVSADKMNKIMQTIVNHTKEMSKLGSKTYRH
jgi:hypothetical protein